MLPLQTSVDQGAMATKGYSPKLQRYWSLTIRLFDVISRTLVAGVLSLLQSCCRCILHPEQNGTNIRFFFFFLREGVAPGSFFFRASSDCVPRQTSKRLLFLFAFIFSCMCVYCFYLFIIQSYYIIIGDL